MTGLPALLKLRRNISTESTVQNRKCDQCSLIPEWKNLYFLLNQKHKAQSVPEQMTQISESNTYSLHMTMNV